MTENKQEIELFAGNFGKDCLGNGSHGYEICCDECDWLMCCIDKDYPGQCAECECADCPRKKQKTPV